MSSVSSTEDSYDHEHYLSDEDDVEHCLERKTSRLVAAVVKNDVDILREHLDSPKWYNVKDKSGYSLLQIAILRNNKEVFDYMLSIPDFPLEFVNKNKETALIMALIEDTNQDEHFAYELVKTGACVDFVSDYGNTPLHLALYQSFEKVALLLIRIGVDVNVCNDAGETPIYVARLYVLEDVTEVCTALLVEGAVPSVRDFEECILSYDRHDPLQELFFLHTHIDQYSEINFHVLLHLAKNKSPLFHEILKCSCKIIFSDNFFYTRCRGLCTLEPEYLELIIRRFRKFVARILHISSKRYLYNNTRNFRIESLDILIKNGFESEVIDSFDILYSGELFKDLLQLGYDESRISQVYLYLLSYGLILREQDLQLVYCQFGYCELFKLFLHMDVEQDTEEIHNKNIVAAFIYDVTMTIPRFLKDYKKYSYESINELFHYFVHRGLTELYYQLRNEGVIPIRDQMAQVPSLLELSRNSLRNYLIDSFKIKTTSKFYTLLNHLPISIAHKKIISYETKIY